MAAIGDLYRELCAAPSDINEHLPMLVAASQQVGATRIIELGVRGGVSTIAWLFAASLAPNSDYVHLWSVDIRFPTDDASVRRLDAADLSRWTFILGHDDAWATLDALPPFCDILFIDTTHTLAQTTMELDLYAPRVRSGGRIILHDTLENGVESGYPVRTAIERFVEKRGLSWTDHPYNNGLGIIQL